MSEVFEFTAENLAEAKKFIACYPDGRQRSAVMPLLDLAQRQNGGWLPEGAVETIAGILDMPPIRVLEVATFYSMYNLAPVGRHQINVCTTTPCWLRGSDEVVGACRQSLGIDVGETTADGEFTLGEVECLGACVNAPVVQVGDDYYEDVDAKSMASIIEALKRGAAPTPGSQTGRTASAPEGGPQVLTGDVTRRAAKGTGKASAKSAGKASAKAADEETAKAADEETAKAADEETAKAADEETAKAADEETAKAADEETAKAADEETAETADEETAKAADEAAGNDVPATSGNGGDEVKE